MTRKTLTAITSGLIALGGLAVGAGPASAATCPAGYHWNAAAAGVGYCSPNPSGGGHGGSVSVDLGGQTPPAPKPPKAPVFTPPAPHNAPVYLRLTKVGAVLKADQSGWAKGTVLKYRWTRNRVPISGATSATYKVRSADKGKTVTVRVTGTKSGHTASTTGGQFLVR